LFILRLVGQRGGDCIGMDVVQHQTQQPEGIKLNLREVRQQSIVTAKGRRIDEPRPEVFIEETNCSCTYLQIGGNH
jgi:hypothetical protein